MLLQYLKQIKKLGMVVHTDNLSTLEAVTEDLELEARLRYIASSRPT